MALDGKFVNSTTCFLSDAGYAHEAIRKSSGSTGVGMQVPRCLPYRQRQNVARLHEYGGLSTCLHSVGIYNGARCRMWTIPIG